jgi:hypothetical protein
MMVGVERDTEVITQPLTFIATANAISYCGAHPVFLDVDMDTLGLSPTALKKLAKHINRLNANQQHQQINNKPSTKKQAVQSPPASPCTLSATRQALMKLLNLQ